ncbi:MAG: MFS transporter [Melioribacteraceae bacterium]|nr:MFS transporter [Melioribacteraceae bacterium]
MNDTKKISFRHKVFNDINFVTIAAVTLIAVLGVSSITPAFPKVEKELGISTQQVGLLITVFTIPGVLLTPIFGVLGDRLGRKKVLVPSLFLFAIAGTLCAFMVDFYLLLFFRFLQGVGSASLGSLNVTLIGDIYKGKERAAVMGYSASVLSVGTAAYPAIGGVLAVFGWNFPFLLPVLALPVGILVITSLHNPEPKNEQSLRDYLISTWESIKNFQVLGIFLTSVVTFIILYGSYLTYFPFLLDRSFGASTVTIGILMSSMSLTTAITSSQLGKLVSFFSEKKLILIAFVLYIISLVLIPLIDNIWGLILPVILFGVAQGMNIPSIQTLLASLAPIEYRAAFMSLNGMVLRLGQTLGPVLMGLIYISLGIEATFYAGAIFGLVMIILVTIMIKEKRKDE